MAIQERPETYRPIPQHILEDAIEAVKHEEECQSRGTGIPGLTARDLKLVEEVLAWVNKGWVAWAGSNFKYGGKGFIMPVILETPFRSRLRTKQLAAEVEWERQMRGRR